MVANFVKAWLLVYQLSIFEDFVMQIPGFEIGDEFADKGMDRVEHLQALFLLRIFLIKCNIVPLRSLVLYL
ncbi:hypothetical protein JCM21738_3115 [Mesobacillus boroniphilus JCM 21738]|uniref:Uncharacterized protein n=1 Tax=Mesobacillus boroniphilus JCM 21738 TaxID=1294265 RepID=W4RQR8_9BACI|nr:hypothetical protein JCM21738_3115 [Mesobacillus boroniphilus JCM 21738]